MDTNNKAMTPIADDYAAIRSRLAEIEAGERSEDTVCLLCVGAGWVTGPNVYEKYMVRAMVCPACENPEGKECP